MTRRGVLVALLGFAAAANSGQAEDPAPSPAQVLRRALRSDATMEDRQAAARRLIDADPLPDPDGVARLAVAIANEESFHYRPVACRLARRALEEGVRAEVRSFLKRAAADSLARSKEGEPEWFLSLAFGIEVGARPKVAPPWPADNALFNAGVNDAPEFSKDGTPSGDAWAFHVRLADSLDSADDDDPKVSRPAMDALLKEGAAAVPYLLAWAAPRKPKTPPGLVGRRARAICVLGMIGDRRAVPVLSQVIVDDAEPGWVRAAAAYALGDLGDVAAVPHLARALFYLGDKHRPRDSWDFPGEGETDVSPMDWNDVEYYAIDEGICDALLRLGVPEAAGWLIRERLDPRKGRWRIRVHQDSLDAIRRAFPDAPTSYVPDGSLPGRMAAYTELVSWWAKAPKPRRVADPASPEWIAAATETEKRLGEKSVMELQIAKKALELYGPLAYGVLVAAVPTATGKVHRQEIAAVLGTIRDRRAVDDLLALTSDPAGNVRAAAAEALAAYHGTASDPRVTGASKADEAGVLARWLSMLDDPEDGPRASAMKALTVVGPNPDVLMAVTAHASATHPENQFGDYVLAEEIVLLVQTGTGLDAVLARLVEPQIFRRRYVWELLKSALRLPDSAFDPTPDPAKTKPLDPALVRAALEKKRGAR